MDQSEIKETLKQGFSGDLQERQIEELVQLFDLMIDRSDINIGLEKRKTTLKEFQEKAETLLSNAKSIREEKNPVYALDNQDADYHANFRFIAESVGITPLQVWAVYALKHITSILTFVKNSDVDQPEPLDERFADAINYLLMGFSLYKEVE